VSDPTVSDRELIERIGQHQDVAAHRTIFDLYYRRVFGMVRRRLNDDSLAEEVVADVFFEIWRGAHSYRGDSQVSTWIFGIAHFKTLSAVRHRSSKRMASVIPTNVETLHQFADEGDPAEALASREALREALQAIDGLPENQREVLKLSVLEGWSYEEIAEHLGVSENTVKTRVSRARSRLKTSAPSAFAGIRR
jgi:RNA polymerase sigma-70 factor (ECF subfamily)